MNTNLLSFLQKGLAKNPKTFLLTAERQDDHQITLRPISELPGGSYAKCHIYAEQDNDTLNVSIGKGNNFDIPKGMTPEALDYLIEILAACIQGKVEEEITEKKGVVVKSNLTLELNGVKITFRYRKGLFGFRGTKKYIKYEPYPLPPATQIRR